MSQLGNLFHQARKRLGLRIVEIARQAGYTNTNKGIRRFTNIENGNNRFPSPEVYRRFIKVLGLDEFDVFQAMADDFAELDRPVPPRLIVRRMACVYSSRPLPEGCTREEAEAVAERVARESGKKVCVKLSRIRGLYINPDGKRFEGYGLPLSDLPFLAEIQRRYPGHSFKEQLRLFRQLAGTRTETTGAGSNFDSSGKDEQPSD